MAAPEVRAFTLSTFEHCPVRAARMVEHEAGGLCVYARSHGGSLLAIGPVLVPLTRPIVLQGGSAQGPNDPQGVLVPAEGAPTLRPVAEHLLGGLSSLLDPTRLSGPALADYERLASRGLTGVTATLELAAPVETVSFSFPSLFKGEGTALLVPLELHLRAAGVLGPDCSLGSASSPLAVALTDGATSPPPPHLTISGKVGTATENKQEVITLTENVLVDNTFAVPPVAGCGAHPDWIGQVDAAINARLGLPLPAGEGTVVLEDSLAAATGARVRAREQQPATLGPPAPEPSGQVPPG